MPRKLRILGLMTGTSCDGLDGSLLVVGEGSCSEEAFFSVPYPKALRKRVLDIQARSARAGIQDLLALDRDLGIWFGKTSKKFLQRKDPIDAIACHGQTIAHFPFLRPQGKTLQIADPAQIAHLTGLTVVHHFRDGDLAAGGQGAPLLPRYHQMLGQRLGGEVSFHNLGGISNLSYISRRGEVLAFDTGPANLWIDESVALHSKGRLQYDRGGKLAAQGVADTRAVNKLLRHWFLRRTPPKSTGRDDFPFKELLASTRARGIDLIATATEFTATSIAHAYQRAVLQSGDGLRTIYFCGGGAKNKTLLLRIAALLPNTRVCTVEDLGLKSEAIEAQGFAYFGALALQGRSFSGPWTGAKANANSGSITPGENWPRLLRRLAQFKS